MKKGSGTTLNNLDTTHTSLGSSVMPAPKLKSLLLRSKTLYHGSNQVGLPELSIAKRDTVGSGAYLTSNMRTAADYACFRSEKWGGEPRGYRARVSNLRMLDARDPASVSAVLSGFHKKLVGLIRNGETTDWHTQQILGDVANKIGNGEIGPHNLRKATDALGPHFSEHCKGLGFHGLVIQEGGEGNMKRHDTYLVFDPANVKTLRETKLRAKA